MTETPHRGHGHHPPEPVPDGPSADGVAGDGPDVLIDDEPSSFWLVLVLGVASLAFGIGVLVWPDASVRVLAVLLGVWLMVAGVARIAGAFASQLGPGRQLLSGTVGVLLLIGGVACLRDMATGVLVLAFLTALAWIFSGLAELVTARRATGPVRAWLVVIALVSIGFGFVLMLFPRLSLAALAVMMGVSGVVLGIGEILFAFYLRRATESSAAGMTSTGVRPT
jgi:uncharacterized membrane protein HdeD (DUF308 family)